MDRSRPDTARSGSWRTDRLVGRPTHVWFFTPKNVAVVGSMKVTFVIRSALGNENPRIMAALTTANIVVTAQMPSASTKTASAQKPLSLVR